MKCDWCGKENDGKIVLVIATVGRFDVCNDCLNKYNNGEYDKITIKADKYRGVHKPINRGKSR